MSFVIISEDKQQSGKALAPTPMQEPNTFKCENQRTDTDDNNPHQMFFKI